MNNIKEYISIIGAGSFGCAMALVLAKSSPNRNILLWARREEVANEINQSRNNKQYLPKNLKNFQLILLQLLILILLFLRAKLSLLLFRANI